VPLLLLPVIDCDEKIGCAQAREEETGLQPIMKEKAEEGLFKDLARVVSHDH